MSNLPHNLREILMDTTRELDRLEDAEMVRVMGRTMLDAALDEADLEGDILASLEDDEMQAYFDTAPEDTEQSPAKRLEAARNRFDGRIQERFGLIGGYELGYAELGIVALLQMPDRVLDPANDSYVQMRITAEDDGKVNIEKTRKTQRYRLTPETLPVTPEDENIVLSALRKLGEINLEIAVNGTADFE